MILDKKLIYQELNNKQICKLNYNILYVFLPFPTKRIPIRDFVITVTFNENVRGIKITPIWSVLSYSLRENWPHDKPLLCELARLMQFGVGLLGCINNTYRNFWIKTDIFKENLTSIFKDRYIMRFSVYSRRQPNSILPICWLLTG